TFGTRVGPREVYHEDIADQLARQRLDAMERAVREYSGPEQAATFRETNARQAKGRLAGQAPITMLAAQKRHNPNGCVVNLANPVMHDEGLHLIEKAAGKGALYVAFMNERNPRVKSGYIADAYMQALKELSAMAQSGRGDVGSWMRNQDVDLDKERGQAE